jgi:hypothetical protein
LQYFNDLHGINAIEGMMQSYNVVYKFQTCLKSSCKFVDSLWNVLNNVANGMQSGAWALSLGVFVFFQLYEHEFLNACLDLFFAHV